MKVSVVIVNFNGKEYIKDCINSVLQSRMKDFEIVVVENGSTDGSWQLLQSYRQDKRVCLVCSKTNRFFTGGCNLGAEKAKGEWLIFLNPDTVVEKNWLTELVKAAGNNRKLTLQPKIKIYSTDKIDCVIGKYLWPGFGVAIGRNKKDNYQGLIKGDYANGTCLMVNRKWFFHLGGFDESFKFFYEDVDLQLRAKRQGGQAIGVMSAVIYHKGSLSFKQNTAADMVRYYYRRNRLVTVIKNFKGINRWIRLGVLGLVSWQATVDGIIGEGFRQWSNQIRFREAKELIRKNKFAWLDLGCGAGQLVQFVKERGIEAVGIDEEMGQKIEEFKTQKRFEVISLCHVLEHLQEPVKVLKQIKQWLKPNGVVLVEVPLVGNLTEKWLKKDYLAYWDKTHRHFLNQRELEQMIKQAGWRIVKQGQTWQEFFDHLVKASFKRGLAKGLAGAILWPWFRLLTAMGLNTEIVRFYARKK